MTIIIIVIITKRFKKPITQKRKLQLPVVLFLSFLHSRLMAQLEKLLLHETCHRKEEKNDFFKKKKKKKTPNASFLSGKTKEKNAGKEGKTPHDLTNIPTLNITLFQNFAVCCRLFAGACEIRSQIL